MRVLAFGAAAVFALTAAAPPPPSATLAFPGRYPTAAAVDLGAAQLISEIDPGATLGGVQIFVSAGLDRETAQNSGIAALVADCISRTAVATDASVAPALDLSEVDTSAAEAIAVLPAPFAAASALPSAPPSPLPTASASASASAAPSAVPSGAPSPGASSTATAVPGPFATPGRVTDVYSITPRGVPVHKPAPAQTYAPGTLSVRDAIAAEGGTLSYTVDGRSTHFYLEGTPDRLPALIALFSKALAKPDFSPSTVSFARASLVSRANDEESNALSVGIEMFRSRYYATGAALPELGSASTLSTLSSSDVANFYSTYYRKGSLSASVVGNASQATTDALRTLAAALPPGTVAVAPAKSLPIPASAPRIVARRDIAVPLVVVGFSAPSPSSKDFGAMLVLESLLSDAFERDSTTTLALSERSVGAFYLYDSKPASLVVYVNGGRVDPSLAMRELLTVAKSLSLKPLGATALKHFKAAAEGEFITDSVSLYDRSYLLGTFSDQGLGNDSINAALAALDRTTSTDIQRVAKNYLQRYIIALVLPRAQGEGT